jgi:hypothetical protein
VNGIVVVVGGGGNDMIVKTNAKQNLSFYSSQSSRE